MHKSIQLRWTAPAERRSIREDTAPQKTGSETQVGIVSDETIPERLDLQWNFSRKPDRTVSGRSLPVDLARWVRALFRAGLTAPSVEVDLDRILVTLLVTDIVDSTKRVAEIGDRNWSTLLDRHDHATRSQIKRYGGREAGYRGDGFVIVFDGPARAVHCAAAIAGTIAPLGLSVRCGIHTGEVHLKRAEVSGIAVHIAARIAATARPGEAFVSQTVRDLVAGSGLVFEDRGVHQLRGLPEAIRLYAMRHVDPTTTGVVNLQDRMRA